MSAKRNFFAKRASIRKHLNDRATGDAKSQLLYSFLPRTVQANLEGGASRKRLHSNTSVTQPKMTISRKMKRTQTKPKLVWKKPEDKWTGDRQYWVKENDIDPIEHQMDIVKKNQEREHFRNLIKKEEPQMTFGEQKELVQISLKEHLGKQKFIKVKDETVDGKEYIKSLSKAKNNTTKSSKRSRIGKSKKNKSKNNSRPSKQSKIKKGKRKNSKSKTSRTKKSKKNKSKNKK